MDREPSWPNSSLQSARSRPDALPIGIAITAAKLIHFTVQGTSEPSEASSYNVRQIWKRSKWGNNRQSAPSSYPAEAPPHLCCLALEVPISCSPDRYHGFCGFACTVAH